MTPDPLDYRLLLQDALRGLVRRALEVAAEQGLTGEHHFYIAFRTDVPEVSLPQGLRDSYPESMTVVIQHQYRDLEVDDAGFSVGLYFGGVLQYISVPWHALLSFVDPSVGFQLGFEPLAEEGAAASLAAGRGAGAATEKVGPESESESESGKVVSLTDFRNKPTRRK